MEKAKEVFNHRVNHECANFRKAGKIIFMIADFIEQDDFINDEDDFHTMTHVLEVLLAQAISNVPEERIEEYVDNLLRNARKAMELRDEDF